MTQAGAQGKIMRVSSNIWLDRRSRCFKKVVDHHPPGASVERTVCQYKYQRDSIVRGNVPASLSDSARVTNTLRRSFRVGSTENHMQGSRFSSQWH